LKKGKKHLLGTLIKNEISTFTKKEEGKKRIHPKMTRSLRGDKRVYVLCVMRVTFPTSHAERSPLNAPASSNTAQQPQRKFNVEKKKVCSVQAQKKGRNTFKK